MIFTGTGTCGCGGRDLTGWLKEFDQLGRAVLGNQVWPDVSSVSWQIHPDVAPQPGELVVNKTSSSALNATSVEQALRGFGAETVFVCGLTTDVCVSTSARDLADRGFQVVLIADACTTVSEQMHEGALQNFNIAFGRVRTAEQALNMLAGEAAAVGAK